MTKGKQLESRKKVLFYFSDIFDSLSEARLASKFFPTSREASELCAA